MLHQNIIAGAVAPVIQLPQSLDNSTLANIMLYTLLLILSLLVIVIIYLLKRSRKHEKELMSLDIQRKLLVDSISDAILLISPEITVMQANQAALDLSNRSSDEIIGLHCCEVIPHKLDSTGYCPVQEVFKDGQHHEKTIKLKNGKVYRVSADPVMDENGLVTAVIKSIRNMTSYYNLKTQLKNEHMALNLATGAAESTWFFWDFGSDKLNSEKNFFDLFEVSSEETGGFEQLISHRLVESDLEILKKQIAGFKDGKLEDSELSFKIKKTSGDLRWIHLHMKLLDKDVQGRPTGIIGVARDTTTERQKNEALVKAVDLQRIVEHALHDLLWMWNLQDDSLQTNDSFKSLLKSVPDSSFNCWKSFEKIIHEDDIDVLGAFTRQLKSGEQEELDCDCRIRIKPDCYHWFRIRGRCVKTDNLDRPLKAAGSIMDIDTSKKQEVALLEEKNKVRLVTENASIGIWELNLEDDSITTSDNWIRITGFPKRTFKLEEWRDAVNPDDFELFLDALRQHLANKQPLFQVDSRVKHPKKGWIWLRTIAKRDDTAPAQRILGCVMDITADKKHEDEINKAKENAENSDRLKSIFLANISHEIRTPLNAIIGFNALALSDDVSLEDRKRYTSMIDRSCDQLLGTINNIVDSAKLESGEIKLDLQPANLSTILRDEFSAFARQLKSDEIDDLSCEMVIDKNAEDVQIICDHSRMRQIVYCLLDNARKFTSKGAIKLICEMKNNDTVQVKIIDTGIGIPEDKLAIIFEPFRQADEKFGRKYGGLGIGLSLVARFVKIMDGSISIHSKEGKGTTSCLEFKIVVQEKPEKKIKKRHEDEVYYSTTNVPDFSNKKILIADDTDSVHMLLNSLLERTGAEVMSVYSGQEAVEMAEGDPEIDLILMDIQMPGMNGLEASEEIKKKNPLMRIMAQTAHAMSGDREEIMASGCDEYISKPIMPDDLYNKIAKLLKN